MKTNQSGAALLAAVILAAALSAATASVLTASKQLVLQLRAREDVLCARYAASSALALPPSTSAGDLALRGLGDHIDSIEVSFVIDDAGRCLMVSEAVCGEGRRRASVELHDDDALRCRG